MLPTGHFSQLGPFSQRSLPSILKIGGTPTHMKVSFAPKSIENLSRPCIEMLSAWRARHKHPDGDDFHLVWRKAKTTSSSTVPVFKGKKRLKAWMPHQPDQQGLKNWNPFLAGCAKQGADFHQKTSGSGDRTRCPETNILQTESHERKVHISHVDHLDFEPLESLGMKSIDHFISKWSQTYGRTSIHATTSHSDVHRHFSLLWKRETCCSRANTQVAAACTGSLPLLRTFGRHGGT